MNYFMTSKRITFPLESPLQINIAIEEVELLLVQLKKISRSPYGAVTKISEAQRVISDTNRQMKERNNGESVLNKSRSYKGAT
tara:strand:- start:2553 stop:2801 length:249 start_codon:yes stop_codon:yes gene_type:complete